MSRMTITPAERVRGLPPYLFARLDALKTEAEQRGVDIINLGIGDPDQPTPPHVVRALRDAAGNPGNHRYPSYEGLRAFREAAARWYKRRFCVDLDPEGEVLTLIGSKEGIGHLPLALINPGDTALIPSPAYPVYQAGTLFAGGRPFPLLLRKENGFLPDLASCPASIAREAKLLFLNYPNNPTAAIAPPGFFKEVVEWALAHNVLICHDAAYSEIYYNGEKTDSFLQTEGAKEVGIEFHSLSKTFNMTGWRIGFAVGNARILKALGQIKSNLDSGVFQAVQEAGIAALSSEEKVVDEIRHRYQERRDILVSGLRRLGFQVEIPRATFYVWVSTPQGYDSEQFASLLLARAGLLTTPGAGFGKGGEGYVRMSLTLPTERIVEAVDRIEKRVTL